jgi:hypothetical protein
MPLSIHAELTGADMAAAGGLVVRAAAPILALCRALIDAGHDPDAPLRAFRCGTLCLQVKSLAAGAALAVAEDRFGRPQFRRWKAPRGDVAAPPIASAGNSDPGPILEAAE